MAKFYDEIPEMTFFVGDTLPIFLITVNRNSLENCSMQMVTSKVKPPKENIITRECDNRTTHFAVHLTSKETESLTAGTYRISFIMTDGLGYEYVKLSGLMHVLSLTEG
ncbi:MAG: hypothetical protein K2I06_11925 [Ruminococcus sp.]|nr:hypothetical protein [Ruminococcus sp.]